MINLRKGEPKIWRWRIRGRSSDSQIVTLGQYDTQDEVKANYNQIIKEGFYRNVKIEQITPPPAPADSNDT